MGGSEGACSVDRGHIEVFELSPRVELVTVALGPLLPRSL